MLIPGNFCETDDRIYVGEVSPDLHLAASYSISSNLSNNLYPPDRLRKYPVQCQSRMMSYQHHRHDYKISSAVDRVAISEARHPYRIERPLSHALLNHSSREKLYDAKETKLNMFARYDILHTTPIRLDLTPCPVPLYSTSIAYFSGGAFLLRYSVETRWKSHPTEREEREERITGVRWGFCSVAVHHRER